MEIYLDRRAVRQIRLSAQDSIDEGDVETLREDIMDSFTEEQIEEVERRIDSGDMYDFLSDILDEWAGDEVDELFELLEAHLSDSGIEIKYRNPEFEDDEEEDEDDDEDDDDEDDDEELEYDGGEVDEEV